MIVQFPHKLLKEVSKPIPFNEINSSSTKLLVANLFKQMYQHNGLGLAAVQIGFDKAVFVYGFQGKNPRYPDLKPIEPTVVINPKIKHFSNENSDYQEGCLSIRGVRLNINRPELINVEYYDINANLQSKQLSGFEARIFQHEYDHTQGITIKDRAKLVNPVALSVGLGI